MEICQITEKIGCFQPAETIKHVSNGLWAYHVCGSSCAVLPNKKAVMRRLGIKDKTAVSNYEVKAATDVPGL